MAKVLVTGSRGYIGTILCPYLVKMGYEVVEFDKVLGDDILDRDLLLDKTRDIDTIVHMAGIVGMKATEEDPQLSFRINVLGSGNVVNCDKRTIYTSVLGAYGDVTEVTEETETFPKHDYFIHKLHGERMISEASEHNIVLRFGTLYGVSPNMRHDLLVHTLTREAVEGKVKIFQPDVMRPITSVMDAVNAITFFVTSGNSGGLYNVVSRNCTKRIIAELAAEINGVELEVVDDVDSENRNYTVSTDRIQKLGFSFTDNLRDSISEISKHYEKALNKV